MSKLPLTVKIPCYLLSLVLGVIILIYSKDFLLPIVLAALLSLLLYPVYKKLTEWKLPSMLAVILTMLVVIVVIVGLSMLISNQVGLLVSDIQNSGARINDKINDFQIYITTRFHVDNVTVIGWFANLKEKLFDISGDIASGALSGTTNFLSTLFLVIIYVFCFLLYNRSFHDFAFALLRSGKQDAASSLISHIQKLVQHYLVGLFIVILILGVSDTIGLYIIGVNHALFFAFFAAVMTIIPYIGILIGAALPVIYILLTKDSAWQAVGVLIVFFIVQVVESNIISPKIIGSKVSVNPFIAIVVLLAGAELWGISGMVLSIPIIAIVKLVLDIQPQTKAFGYFLGSEFTNKKVNPAKVFGKKESESPKK